jgi:hypothetical protein
MKILKIALTILFILPILAKGNIVTGSYVGNGSATNAITGLGHIPSLLLVKGAGGEDAWMASSSMASGYAMQLTGNSGIATGMITTFDSDGFTVDKTLGLSNESGVTYYYTAWDAQSVTIGSFTPNDCSSSWGTATWYSAGQVVSRGGSNYHASSGHTSGASDEPGVGGSWATKWSSLGVCSDFDEDVSIGFEPGMVWVFGGTSTWYEVTYPQMSMNGVQPTYAHRFNTGSRITSSTYKILNDFHATGFQTTTSSIAGTHSGPSVGVEYHYAAFNTTVSSFSGNNSVAQDISVSVDPAFVLIKNVAGASDNTWWKTVDMPSTTAYKFTDVASTISITGFSSSPDEFSVGTNGEVNGTDNYEYVVFGGDVSLPVELISFDVEKESYGVQVSWSTASEVNNDYFEVFASADGIQWKSIGTVTGSGNSAKINNYSLVDLNTEGFDYKYYKLGQFDFDGKTAYSKSKFVRFMNGNRGLEAFDDGIYINIFFDGEIKDLALSIYDVNAKVIFVKNINSEEEKKGQIRLKKTTIEQGVYFLQLTDGSEVYSTKLLVQRK